MTMFLSVALCTYNGEFFLEQQLNSILDQTAQVNEIIICDDCSTDKTIDIIELFINKYPRIIQLYKNKESLGTIKNFEKAISLTTGDLIFLSDQDDIWHKDKVEITVNFFNENNNCKLLFSNGELIDENGGYLNATLWEKWDFSTEMQKRWKNNKNAFQDLIMNNNKITGATVCFHKSLKNVVLPIEVPFGYWHDCWLGIHASAQDGLMFIEKSLINYRIHNKQQVGISSDISYDVIAESNKNRVNRNLFYERIGKKYSYKKNDIPYQKQEKLVYKILKKIKNYLS